MGVVVRCLGGTLDRDLSRYLAPNYKSPFTLHHLPELVKLLVRLLTQNKGFEKLQSCSLDSRLCGGAARRLGWCRS